MSRAEEIHDRVESVVAEQGVTKKEAHEIVAKEAGLKPSSVRGLCYKARVERGETGPRRVRETTTEGAVASAVETLEKARDAIDDEVEAAKERASEAAREAKSLSESAASKRAEIDAKIKALTA
jgi:hypothetical protein